MVRSDTRKYRIRRKKVSKKIRRGGEGVVAQRVQSIERRNNPLYNKPFTQKAKKQKGPNGRCRRVRLTLVGGKRPRPAQVPVPVCHRHWHCSVPWLSESVPVPLPVGHSLAAWGCISEPLKCIVGTSKYILCTRFKSILWTSTLCISPYYAHL